MTKKELIMEYERIVMGKKRNYPTIVLSKNSQLKSEKNAKKILIYAFEELLNWSPHDICNMLTDEIIKLMHLDIPLNYICIPLDIDQDTKNKFIANYLYPSIIQFNDSQMTISIYKKVLSKQLYSFPKKFLNEEEGRKRACVCLHYVIQNFLHFHNIEELYSYFAKIDGVRTLKKYQLFNACNDLFDTPIDFIHESLPESQQNEFLYHYFKFNMLYIKAKKERNKKET